MIVLGTPTASGYESVALAELIEQEPEQCREAAATGLAALK